MSLSPDTIWLRSTSAVANVKKCVDARIMPLQSIIVADLDVPHQSGRSACSAKARYVYIYAGSNTLNRECLRVCLQGPLLRLPHTAGSCRDRCQPLPCRRHQDQSQQAEPCAPMKRLRHTSCAGAPAQKPPESCWWTLPWLCASSLRPDRTCMTAAHVLLLALKYGRRKMDAWSMALDNSHSETVTLLRR